MEYIALGYAARKVIWIRRFINKIKLETVKSVILYGNNKMSIALTKNAKNQYQIKQINVQYYYIRELVNKKELIIE